MISFIFKDMVPYDVINVPQIEGGGGEVEVHNKTN